MKLTRSLPANAMASENVPSITITLSTFTPMLCSNCISTAKKTKQPMSITTVFSFMAAITSGDMNERSFMPLNSMK